MKSCYINFSTLQGLISTPVLPSAAVIDKVLLNSDTKTVDIIGAEVGLVYFG